MRKGMNPNRERKIERKLPPELPVVCVLTSLPHEDDYHSDGFEITTKSLMMARQNAGMEHYFVVWDNGSCDTLRRWLIDFAPDNLILSENIGVMNALNRLCGLYQDSIIAYSNDDIIYYKDWLKPQVDILKHFPNVGTVTGCVTRYYSGKADDHTLDWMRNNCKTIGAANPPTQWDMQHGESIGKERSITANIYANAVIPYGVYNGMSALVGGNHCQMVFYAETMKRFTRNVNEYMYPLFTGLDIPINRAKLLRLMTEKRLTRHIGNILTDADREEIKNECR